MLSLELNGRSSFGLFMYSLDLICWWLLRINKIVFDEVGIWRLGVVFLNSQYHICWWVMAGGNRKNSPPGSRDTTAPDICGHEAGNSGGLGGPTANFRNFCKKDGF